MHHLTQKGGSVNIVGEKVSLERRQSETDPAALNPRARRRSEEEWTHITGLGGRRTAGAKCGSSELDHTLSPDE